MKKKKGFTLIELLAVIVVLAVLLVISVPKIIDIIEKAEMKAYKESVELMAHTVQIQYNAEEVTGSSKEIPEEGIVYEFENGEYISENVINFKGDRPNSGRITLTQNKKIIVEKLVSKNKKWCAIKEENEKNVRVGRSTDEEFACVVSEEVVDKKACELEEGTEVINGEEKEVYYVDSVCDMYEFSNRVNNGENFSGKVVKLRNNVDMSDIESIEDTLVSKYETTEFNPIGSGSRPFSGTFDGGAKTISNLEINKPNQDNVGIFGYINGSTIYGINLENIEVIGNSSVGGLAGGDFRTTVKEISLKNVNVTGTGSAINLLVGDYWQSSRNNILVKSGEVNAPNDTAYGLNYTSNSIIENISLNGKNTSYGLATNGYYSNNCTLNGVQETNGFDPIYIDDINYYTYKVETSVQGDVNKTGYYFDYVGDEILVVEAGSSSVVEGQTGTSSTHAYTVSTGTDKIAPTCELKNVTPLTNGFAYTFTCTDNAKVEEIRSLFDSKPYSGDYDSSTFEKVGTKKNGSSADNNKTISYTSRWTTSKRNMLLL